MNPVSRRASKTSKKKSAQSVRPRRGEMPGKGSTGSRHSAEADEGAETTIFVRVKQRLKDLIPDYGSDKEVISKLLEHFERLPEGERRAITERGQTLERVGELLAEESWANHYFAREHWAAAARSYCRLASSLTLSEHHRGFALYRLAYTTHEIAKKLRVTALKSARLVRRTRTIFSLSAETGLTEAHICFKRPPRGTSAFRRTTVLPAATAPLRKWSSKLGSTRSMPTRYRKHRQLWVMSNLTSPCGRATSARIGKTQSWGTEPSGKNTLASRSIQGTRFNRLRRR